MPAPETPEWDYHTLRNLDGIYFDDVAGSEIRGTQFTPLIWLYAQNFLILVAVTCLAQVVFNVLMAPFEEVKEHHVNETDLSKISFLRETTKGAGRRETANIIRKGTPNELKRDVYFYFMDGGWFRFTSSLVFLYFISNVFFAALYAIKPGCIDNSSPESFADEF